MGLIDSIYDIDSLQKAVNTYVTKSEGSFGNPQTELSLAYELSDLSENLSESSDAKKIFDIAGKVANFQIIERGSIEAKSDFAGYVAFAYSNAAYKEKPTPAQAKKMLSDLSYMSQYTDYPADCFNINLPLDDKKTAENFLKYTEKALQQVDEKNGVVKHGDGLIKQYAEIVQHHPEMAKKCNELVNKTANLNERNGMESYTYDDAHNYFEKVKEMDGISYSDKLMAKARSETWKRKAEQAKEREKEQGKEQSHHQTQQKTKEPDFKQMNFGDFEIER